MALEEQVIKLQSEVESLVHVTEKPPALVNKTEALLEFMVPAIRLVFPCPAPPPC